MKVIFLDIDGVLNSNHDIIRGVQLDPEKMLLVRDLSKEFGAEIVASTSWNIMGTKNLNFILKSVVPGFNIHDITPHLEYMPDKSEGDLRGREITQWLSEHSEVTHYVVLDDDPVSYVEGHLVLTDPWKGITEEDIEKAREILRG